MTRIPPDYFPFLIISAFGLVALIVFWSIMDMVLLGASLAVVLLPVYHKLAGRTKPVIAASITTVAVFFILAVFAAVTLLILQANSGTLANLFGTIGSWLTNPASNPTLFGVPLNKETFSALFEEGQALFVNYWSTVTGNIILIAFKAFVFFFSLFILLLHGENLKQKTFTKLPLPVKRYVDHLTPVTVDVLYAIYIVQVAIAVLTFFIALPVFYLLGYGNIFFYSYLAAFCELIPILGSSVTFIIIGAYAYAIGDLTGVLILFVLGYLIVSLLPEVYVRPVLVGRRVKIHPVIMFIGIIGGLLTMGLAGFVLGPLIIVLLMTSYRIWMDERDRSTAS